MDYPKVVAAARRAEKSMWPVADALLIEVGKPPGQGRDNDRQRSRFSACSKELAANGITSPGGKEYSIERLFHLRNIAHVFKPTERPVSTEHAIEAGTPAVLRKAQEMADEDGKTLTKRYIAMVRKANAAVKTKKKKAKEKKPKTKTDKAAEHEEQEEETTTTENRHMSDVLTLNLKAKDAAKLGNDFIKLLNDIELDEEERDTAITFARKAALVWTTAAERAGAEKSIADEATAYLKAM